MIPTLRYFVKYYAVLYSSGVLLPAISDSFDILGGISDYSVISQLSNILVGNLRVYYLEQPERYYISAFDPIGSVYLRHPLVEIDTSAFNEFVLRKDNYHFIEKVISITNYEEISHWFREKIEKK